MRFEKLHGLGNDFILVDRLKGGEPVAPARAVALCDRRRGIGADGVLTVLPSAVAFARMHVTNSDGSIAEMCGNGLRCVVRYLAEQLEASVEHLLVETGAGVRSCRVHRDPDGKVSQVEVDMGAPELEASKVPMAGHTGRFVAQALTVAGVTLRGTAVSMGNPHLVLFGADRARAAELAPQLERHPWFPARVNVEFAQVVGEGLDVVVWERGCGFTQACGTGACATVVAATLEGRLAPDVERAVKLAGGTLWVRVAADLSRVSMRGPAERVFVGEVED